jgi:hypothetical protein
MDYFGSIVNSFTPPIAAPKAQKKPKQTLTLNTKKSKFNCQNGVNLSRQFAREFYLYARIMSLRASSGAQKRPG